MQFGRRQRKQTDQSRAFTSQHWVETLEERKLLAATPLDYANPVQTVIATTGAPVIAVDVGDLNGDGVPDVAALDGASAVGTAFTVEPFIGTSKGSYTPNNLVEGAGEGVALGDFNGDGKLDLATAAGVLPGNGDGTFQAAVTGFSEPVGAQNFIAADFNGDGKLDLAVVTLLDSGQSQTIGLDILIGNGDGTFKTPVVTTVKTGTGFSTNDTLFFLGDFNNDSKLDVVTPFGLLLGKGDGTFTSAAALPISPGLANPVFTAGDVNNDGNLDLLMVGASSKSGQAELLTGKGDGTFTDAGAVTIGSSGTVTALTLVDLNADGFPELAAGIQPGGSASQIALLTNNGSGAFGTATTFNVDGAPLEIFAADANADSIPDVICIDSTAGLIPGAGTTFNATEVATLISNSTTGGSGGSGGGSSGGGSSGGSSGSTLRPPDISVRTTHNTIQVGTPVTLTVNVHQRTGIVVPTGAVSFSINGRSIGTATLNKFGVARITFRRLAVGKQPIRVIYSGDANFGIAHTAVSELVLSTLNRTPLVSAALAKVTFSAAFVTGDTGRATVSFTDGGNADARGVVSVALYLTQNGRIDDNSVPLKITQSPNVNISLTPGHRQSATFEFIAPKVTPGLYQVVARVSAVSGLPASELAGTTVVNHPKFRAADNQFGVLSRNNRIASTLTDGSGHSAVFSITGPGVATVSTGANGIDITVTGTTGKSTLVVTGDSGFRVDHITIKSPIRVINAPVINLTGGMVANGRIQSIMLGSATGGAWALRNGAGTVQLNGALLATQIFGGANAGRDGVLGTADDSFATSSIDSLVVGGAMTSSTVAAGVAPASGATIFTRQTLLPKGRLGSIVVRGSVDSTSRFVASVLPTHAVLNNQTITVGGDVHFV